MVSYHFSDDSFKRKFYMDGGTGRTVMSASQLIKYFIFFFVYFLIATLICWVICTFGLKHYYKAPLDILISGPDDIEGYIYVILEFVLSFLVILLNIIWIFETCYNTSKVHPGMKLVFFTILQTSFILVIGRLVVLIGCLYPNRVHVLLFTGAKYLHDTATYQFYVNPAIMAIERLIATINIKSYENTKMPLNLVLVIGGSWTYAICFQFVLICFPDDVSYMIYLGIVYVEIALQFITLFVAFILYRINHKHYQEAYNTLSQRYQTAENIHLLRAVLKFTVINVICDLIVQGFSFCMTAMENNEALNHRLGGLWNLVFVGGLFSINLVILDATGTLKKFKRYFYRNKRRGTQFTSTQILSNGENVLRSVTGKIVPMNANSNDYFSQLKNAWQ